MRIGTYLDLNDLYHRFKPRKLNFAAVMAEIKLKFPGEHIFRAYGIQQDAGFAACLNRLGYLTRFKSSNWDCSIAVDVMRDACDIIILGSGNGAFADLPVSYLLTISPSRDLKAPILEIPYVLQT